MVTPETMVTSQEPSTGNNLELHRLYLEFVVYATFLGLLFPVVFLGMNTNVVPRAMELLLSAGVIVVAVFLLGMLSAGKIFPQLSATVIRWVLYLWGLFLLGLATSLVHLTGGLQSSIFVWLFEYAVVVSLMLSPRKGGTFFQNFRPAILTVLFEIAIVASLMIWGPSSSLGPPGPSPPSVPHMPIWGGFSVINSLLISLFLFWVTNSKLQKGVGDD